MTGRQRAIILIAIIVGVIAFLVSGCTANSRAKNFGGTLTIDLPAGTKLVTATWKEAALWYLTRPARPGETPETLTFKEDSSWGLFEGKVIFTER